MGTMYERHVVVSAERVAGGHGTVTVHGTGRQGELARWSSQLRLPHRAPPAVGELAVVRQVGTPAGLIRAAGLARVDFTDTFALRLPPPDPAATSNTGTLCFVQWASRSGRQL